MVNKFDVHTESYTKKTRIFSPYFQKILWYSKIDNNILTIIFTSNYRFEKLENDNAELVRKLAESAKARSEEVETWAKKIRQAVTE